MSEDKPRLARLTAMITHLQSRRMVTARDMAKKYNVSIRTIYRDIRTLEQSGIPIATEEGKGYSMQEGYTLPPVMFTEEEANALITAGHLVHKNKDRSFSECHQSAVTKIKAVLRGSQKSKTEFLSSRLQVRNNKENAKTSDYLIRLQSTIANLNVVELCYYSLDAQYSERKVEPFALYTTHDNWILIAFCRKRKDFRAFRLDRIRSLTVTDEFFAPHTLTLEQYLEACRKKLQHTPDIPLAQDPSTFASK